MEPDHVDEVIAQWSEQRPDVNVAGMAIIARISRLEKLIRPQLSAVFATHHLESWEFDVMATLLRNGPPHQLTPGQLLDSMMITSGSMTNRIDRLEERGFVKRIAHPTDGRQVLVALTKQGIRKVDAALVEHAANEAAIVSVLSTTQQAQLAELLRLLNLALAHT